MNNNTIEIQKEFKNFLSSPIPISEQKWNKDTMPLVSISCITYNHENYIRDAIEGFLMQETTFPVEILIHDDASTDGTANIIRKYEQKFPNLIKPIYQKENQYSKQDGTIGHIQRNRAKGKYYALCEGDDYWIDPLKLQKQVAFLEENPEYIMSHTSFKYYYQEQNKYFFSKDIFINPKYKQPISEDILFGYRIQTCTVICRMDAMIKARSNDRFLFEGYFLMGDTQLWFELSKLGKIHFLQNVTSVYRKNEGSATRGNNAKGSYKFYLSSAELRYYLSLHNQFSTQNNETIKRRYHRALSNYLAFDKDFIPLFKTDFSLPKTIRLLDSIGIRKYFLSLKLTIKKRLGVFYRIFQKYY